MAVPKRASNSSIQADPQQQKAIEHVSGPMLVLAGAGTGKTTVLIQRIAELIREGHARADEILALTYTNNAAAEMLERVQRELRGESAKGLQVCTFHAYCNNLLIRSKRSFSVLDDKQLWVFLRRNVRELHLNYFVRAANTAKFLDDLLDFVRRCHDELVGPEQYREYVQQIERGQLPLPRVSKSKDAEELSEEEALDRCREIANVFETVERMLRERNLGTFGHMILRTYQLLAEDQLILEREVAKAKFILVDEFQDANFAQIKVLEQLAGPGRNVFVVGDPDQGIYRFRGASSGAFELFQKYFPGSKLASLSRNRRSTTSILRCAHALIAENPEFALRAEGSEYRRLPLISVRDEQESNRAEQRAPVQAVLVSGSFMEATDLATTLQEHRRRSRCSWKDISVLYRIHTHRDEIAAELARRNIPFSIEGLDVLDTAETRDLLACLRATLSSSESGALFRVAALQQFSVDASELRAAMRSLPRETKNAMAAALAKVEGGEEVLRTVESARNAIGGQKAHAALLSVSSSFRITRGPAVQTMLQYASAWESSPLTETGSPAEFLEYLDYFREARGTIPLTTPENEDAVKLMSVHGAKGLEFDHVFIVRAIKGSFPCYYREPLIELPAELRNSGLAGDDEKKIYEQEERRLFYVAMTRARDTLMMYGQFGRGEKDKTPPGFLRELIKHRELKSYFRHRTCREFQTDIFGAAEPPARSRLGEWIGLSPASDLASTLSASAIDRYQMCPLQFKLEREWRIPAEVSAAVQYGASVHRVLLTYFNSVRWDRALAVPELLKLFREDLANESIADRYQHDLYERQGIEQLQEFISCAQRRKPDVLHTEEQFSMKIGATTLVGRIDRIDRVLGDHVVITDYKTGKPKSQEDADESLQLSLYALAARVKWGYHAERLVFHNLDGNTAISTARSEAELEEAKLKVEEVAEKISAGKFDATPGFHCAWCSYRLLCPKTERRVPELVSIAAGQKN
ncbi:MAG TPA: ATP-dependent DNA helicase [Terriglobales bacterium]|nr:ATP-dependent DNA helicase [Terriglobales bacterium]